MHRFLEAMDQYDPSFRSRIRGVSEREIAALEELYQRPLPDAYRWFLRTMGADAGGFELIYKADTRYDKIFEFTEGQANDEPLYSDTLHHFVYIAIANYQNLWLALLDSRPGEPPLAGVDVGVIAIFSSSLLNMMMGNIYLKYTMNALPHRRAWASGGHKGRDRAISLVRNLGFEPTWFADEIQFFAERGAASLRLSQADDGLVSVYMRSAEIAPLDEVGAVVERELGLSTDKVHFLTE